MQSKCKRYEMYIPKYPMWAYRKFSAALVDTFGAFTEIPLSTGVWTSPCEDQVMQEGVSVFIAVITPDREEELLTILGEYKGDADQQAVMLVSSPIDVVML